MKRLLTGLLLVTAIIFSCRKGTDCGGNCAQIFPNVNFRIVNSGGQNLTSGPAKLYTSDKVTVKAIVNGTLIDEIKGTTGDTTTAGGGLFFTASSTASQYYLYINNAKTDSFQLVYASNPPEEDCCPGYYSLTQLKLNNVATTYVYPNPTTTVTVVK